MDYNYFDGLKEDVKRWIKENIDKLTEQEFADEDDLADYLNDELWQSDGVTGNASGSYWFSAYKAEEALAHNWGLLADACDAFCIEGNPFSRGPEWCDSVIRLYLLSEVIADIVPELFNSFRRVPLF